jgi:hypothetical protein
MSGVRRGCDPTRGAIKLSRLRREALGSQRDAAGEDHHQRRKSPSVAVVWIQDVYAPRVPAGACSAT